MSDCASNRPCGITSEMLEGVASLKESVTSLSKPTNRNGRRRYHHTPAQIAQELRVDEEGNLWWLKRKGCRQLAKPVGRKDKDGYLYTLLDGHRYTGHVLAWILYYNELPDTAYDIDHINGKRTDNRKDNLRLVTRSKNMLNSHRASKASTSGFPGVSYRPDKGKWRAYIKIDYRQISGGYYSTKEEAIAARLKLEAIYEHGIVPAQAEPI